jgi:hypothetical protein
MTGTNRPEVPVVQGGDLSDVQPFGDSDDRGVGGPEREVGVGLHKFDHPNEIRLLEAHVYERAFNEGAQEGGLNPGPGTPLEEVADLSDHRRRDQDLAPGEVQTSEEVDARTVVLVITVQRGDKRAGIADDH